MLSAIIVSTVLGTTAYTPWDTRLVQDFYAPYSAEAVSWGHGKHKGRSRIVITHKEKGPAKAQCEGGACQTAPPPTTTHRYQYRYRAPRRTFRYLFRGRWRGCARGGCR